MRIFFIIILYWMAFKNRKTNKSNKEKPIDIIEEFRDNYSW